MKFLRRFFRDVVNASVPNYDKKFYPSIIKETYGRALGYFLFFVFLISLIIGAVATKGLQLAVKEFSTQFESEVPEFELTITNGVVTTNLPQPYIIPDFLVIDTTGQIASLEGRTESILLGPNKLHIKENSIQTNVIDLSTVDSFHITKENLRSFMASSKGGLFILAYILIVIGVWIGIGIWYFLYTLLFSFIGWLFVKKRLRFAQVHQIGLYAITGPVIFISIWHLFAPYTPYLFSIVFIGYLILALQNTKRLKGKR